MGTAITTVLVIFALVGALTVGTFIGHAVRRSGHEADLERLRGDIKSLETIIEIERSTSDTIRESNDTLRDSITQQQTVIDEYERTVHALARDRQQYALEAGYEVVGS
jgi:chromosome segregation ATPase